jgi:Uma2 family endonuclease
VSHERAAILQDWVRGAPDLCIEILSESTRRQDETFKRRLYERAGVQEYWIVDPELECVRVYRRAGDVFGRVVELTREKGDAIETPLLPEASLSLDEIFRAAAAG